MRRLVALAIVAAAFGLPDAAHALTQKQANAIAIRTLRPQAQPGRVVLFGLPRALSPRQSVSAASRTRLGLPPRKTGLRPLGRKAWLFWLDLQYQAHFVHPSVMLVVDDATGRVLVRRRLDFYPLVDGARPAFLRTRAAYNGRRYRVFAKNLAGARRAATSIAMPPLARSALPPNAFRNDCVLMIGTWNDPSFEKDFVDTERIMESLGARTFWATRDSEPAQRRPKEHGSATFLDLNVSHLVRREDCKDILILASGHGTKLSEPAGVIVGEAAPLTPAHLDDAIRQNPGVTFKLKIDACHSGRFLQHAGLSERTNLVFFETASGPTEASYGALTLHETEVPNPGRSEFIHSNLVGITRFVQSNTEIANAQSAGGSLFVRMLERAFTLGAGADAARRAGYTHPAPPRVRHAAPAASLEIRVWYWHPPDSDFSFLCVEWKATGGHDLRVAFFGAGSGETTLNLSESPGPREGVVALRILSFGLYRIDATLTTRDGGRVDRSATVEVTAAQGGPPCGG